MFSRKLPLVRLASGFKAAMAGRTAGSVSGVALALATGVAALAAADTHVPIKAGDYAAEGFDCQTAPLAGLMHYDGRNFSGPHESDCDSVVQQASGGRYKVATTCRALGDGTATAPTTFVETYQVLSADRVKRLSAGPAAGAVTYRHCVVPAK